MSDENESKRSPSSQPMETGQSPRTQNIPDELLNMVGASPPRFVTFEQLMSAADGIKNMTLAHEIAVNNDFVLHKEEDSSSSIEKQVAETVKRAFWDAFAAKISQDPPDFTMAYVMLEELKETLVGILLPQHQRLKDQINEVLDMPLIKQQMEQRVFDFEYYGRYVTDTMARLCAPARDEKIAEIRTIQDVVPKFKAIMETLELMRRDMANFTIKQIRPYIQQNSIDYERKKFSEYYETQKALGANPLKYTEVWLKRNFEKLVQSTGQNLTSSSTTSTPTPANVLNEAYIEILEWSDPNNFPETLMLDQLRFMALRDKLHTLGLITSVQLITYSVVGSPVEGVEDLKQKLRDHVDLLLQDVAQKGIKAVQESIAEQVVKDVSDSIIQRGLPPLTEKTKLDLKGQILSLGSRENTVRRLMITRLMEFIREGMTGKQLNSLRVPKGCTVVQEEVSQVLGNFLRLTSHNRSVFGEQYSQILGQLMHRSGSDISPRGNTVVNAQ
ncbi:T-complex protein 11-like protein 1 [Biomphalaria pfeifferi]|uniref:T-complex protein 11-like protein 1 n=1 Tax=Biomphalaria pfeifferi TaxID=112525 RepID=A0AAD8AZL9_BIOPF|nr:T-complex protein 11-like protein 1 [Biomphalaria pfeifferi]